MGQQLDPLKQKLAEKIYSTLKNDLPDDVDLAFVQGSLEFPQDVSMGDYAFPCFKLSRHLRKNPMQIADELKGKLESSGSELFEKIDSVKGFLNFFINTDSLANDLFPKIKDETFFNLGEENAKTRVMVEYSQPNTHKEFHVGHGRNVCLGNCLQRLYKYLNFDIIGVNYIGDEGTHIAKCLFAVQRSGEKIPEENRAEWLGQKYVEANNLLADANEKQKVQYEKEISDILSAIESKNGPIYDLWIETRKYCLDDFDGVYNWLDVKFDHFFYESEVSEEAQQVVERYLKTGLFKEDQGAIGIDMDSDKLGFMMVRKSDGNTLYITKDISLAEKKFEDFKIDRNIYVVASEQEFHFKQLFNFFKKAGFKHADDCYHLSYGMVRRADGKMSSRKGNSFTFFDLVSMVKEKLAEYLKKYEGEWSPEQMEETSDMLALGAIKYGMLNTDPKKDIVFEPEDWIRFDGNSGPYLMYCHSRAWSILKKAEGMEKKPNYAALSKLTHDSEKRLVLEMSKFNQTVSSTLEHYRPALLSNYLYGLCKYFNQFYVNVTVLKEEDSETLEARLALIEVFTIVLRKGLDLLGIKAPYKM